MNNFNKYPSYKESGIEWLKKIPNTWETKQVRAVTKTLNNNISKDMIKDKLWFYYDIPNVQQFGKGRVEDGANIDSNKFKLVGGEILISKLNPRKNTVTETIKSGDLPMICSTEFVPLLPKMIYPRYLYYSLSNDVVADLLNSFVKSVTYSHQRVNPSDIEKTYLPFPSAEEQQVIANFLDDKTSEMDSLISDKEKIIELLEEKRQAIITEAVTKGLNPDVKMKDSGVEWIGEVPEHWDIVDFRRISTLQQGLQVAQEQRFYAPGKDRLEYITIKSINANSKDSIKEYVENPSVRVTCSPEDILLSRTGATGIVVTDLFGVFHNNFFKINYNKDKIDKNYLVYYLKQEKIQEHFKLVAGTTTIPDLNHGEFLSTKCLVPPFTEQRQIYSYLDQKTEQIEETIKEIRKQLGKLKEYRQSLIYEAVTGKIDVREYKKVLS